mmetsp:Transcript_39345/g.80703  ORF Transcript_39345/g.80703 Transcript_39345/m.80703 type:complete len:112 (+) Transcript_39345:417-752(+)
MPLVDGAEGSFMVHLWSRRSCTGMAGGAAILMKKRRCVAALSCRQVLEAWKSGSISMKSFSGARDQFYKSSGFAPGRRAPACSLLACPSPRVYLASLSCVRVSVSRAMDEL